MGVNSRGHGINAQGVQAWCQNDSATKYTVGAENGVTEGPADISKSYQPHARCAGARLYCGRGVCSRSRSNITGAVVRNGSSNVSHTMNQIVTLLSKFR